MRNFRKRLSFKTKNLLTTLALQWLTLVPTPSSHKQLKLRILIPNWQVCSDQCTSKWGVLRDWKYKKYINTSLLSSKTHKSEQMIRLQIVAPNLSNLSKSCIKQWQVLKLYKNKIIKKIEILKNWNEIGKITSRLFSCVKQLNRSIFHIHMFILNFPHRNVDISK